MAVTVINLSDPISTLVTKSNTIASDLGDKATLGTTTTSSLVAAINEINTKVAAIDTGAEIAAQVETFFNSSGNVLDVHGFHADSANIDSASITHLAVSGNFIADSALFDSATITNLASTNISVDSADFAKIRLDSVIFQHAKPLSIKDSTGTVVLAGYLLSTSNTDGTL
jgi:hypothetical protein